MDTTQTTHISLCSGYGGIDLGLRRVIPDLRTVAYAEIEAFACENLLARMEGGQLDAAPIWSNLKTFPWEQFSGLVDILSGGYPCQPFSAAGKRAGADDPRHLWPFISAGIAVLRPNICFFENVEGHISLGLPDVIEDLGRLGYRATWGIFSAAETGAPHQRKRVFIMAHRKDKRLPQFVNIGTIRGEICSTQVSGELAHRNQQGLEGSLQQGVSSTEKQNEPAARHGRSLADSNSAGSGQDWESSQPWAIGVEQPSCFERRGDEGEVRERQAWPSRPGEPQHAWEPPRVVGNAESGARFRQAQGTTGHATQSDEGLGDTQMLDGSGQAGGQRETQAGRADTARYDRQTQPALGGDADGAASGLDYAELCVTCDNRTDELRLLGNGVVPATAALAFRTLLKELTQ